MANTPICEEELKSRREPIQTLHGKEGAYTITTCLKLHQSILNKEYTWALYANEILIMNGTPLTRVDLGPNNNNYCEEEVGYLFFTLIIPHFF